MNYEKQYKELLKENEELKAENEEIINEYESTIKLLTETAENYKEEKESIELKYNLISNSKKTMKDDLEGYKAKNKDKMKDIELLNKQINKLQSDLSKAIDVKKVYENKIVTLENDNDHFITKLREHEAIINDLTSKLESSLEENIFLQNDLEHLKHTTEEQLQRKEEKMEEMKNEILSKDNALNKALSYSNKSIKKIEPRESFKNRYEMRKSKEESFIKSAIQKKSSGSFYNIITPINGIDISEKATELYTQSMLKKERREYHSYNNKDKKKEEEKGKSFRIITFAIEIRGDNEQKEKERTSKIREGVKNIKDILSKIQERKRFIINDQTIIKTKLNKFGIKL